MLNYRSRGVVCFYGVPGGMEDVDACVPGRTSGIPRPALHELP